MNKLEKSILKDEAKDYKKTFMFAPESARGLSNVECERILKSVPKVFAAP